MAASLYAKHQGQHDVWPVYRRGMANHETDGHLTGYKGKARMKEQIA